MKTYIFLFIFLLFNSLCFSADLSQGKRRAPGELSPETIEKIQNDKEHQEFVRNFFKRETRDPFKPSKVQKIFP